MTTTLLAGAHEVNITPPLDVPLGSGFAGVRLEQIADELYARALVISDGSTRVVLTSSDILSIDPTLARDVRERVQQQLGIPGTHVMVSGTHNHSCGGRLQPSRGNGDPALMEIIARSIASAVVSASDRLEPVKISAGEVSVEGVNISSRDPDAPVDRVLRLLRVDGDKRLIAVLATYACHPLVVAHDRPVISADYPGAFVQTLKATLGKSVVVLPTNGPAGDVYPIASNQDGVESARWIGHMLGGQGLTLLSRLEVLGKPLRSENTRWGLVLTSQAPRDILVQQPRLRAGTTIARLPYKQFRPATDSLEDAASISRQLVKAGVQQDLVKRWEALQPVPDDSESSLTGEARTLRRQLVSDLLRSQAEAVTGRVAAHQGLANQGYRELELQAFALNNDVAFLGVPFELFSEIGRDIRAESPFKHLHLLTYSNDLGGYLMPDAEHSRSGFEAGMTYYGLGAALEVKRAAVGLLQELAKT